MRVLGLVASPRRVGNSEIIIQEMLNILPETWGKEVIRLNNLQIERCKACYACLPHDKSCVINDDLNFLLDRIRAADKVIIVSPVYALGQQTTLKLINDRMICIQNKAGHYFTGKQCVIVIPHTVEGWEGYAREATMHFARFFGLNITGTAVMRASLPSDITEVSMLGKIRELTLSLIDNSTVNFDDIEKIYCPDCSSSFLQLFHKGRWRCVICGSTGDLKVSEGNYNITWDIPEHRRFTLKGIQEHGQRLSKLKEEFAQRKKEQVAVLTRNKADNANKNSDLEANRDWSNNE